MGNWLAKKTFGNEVETVLQLYKINLDFYGASILVMISMVVTVI